MMHIAIVEDFVFDQKHLINLIQKNFEKHGEMADFTCYESGEGAVALTCGSSFYISNTKRRASKSPAFVV